MNERVLVANPNVVVQQTNDGAILMDMASGDCFELNRLGAEVWARLGKGESPTELVANVASSYGVAAATVQSDVQALLQVLTQNGLLTSTTA
jgi:coenzyme PQQ synthesis protein D (PqqD)